MAKRKCVICGEYIENNDESVPYKKRYAHVNCFNVAMKIVTTDKNKKTTANTTASPKKKPQKELKEGLTEEEYQDKTKLCDYIKEKTQNDLTVKIYKLIDDYKKKYKLTYKDMYMTLYWYFSIRGNPIGGDMVGIIPYTYDEAKRNMQKLQETQEDCESKIKKIQEFYPNKTISSPVVGERVIDQIDISKIGE